MESGSFKRYLVDKEDAAAVMKESTRTSVLCSLRAAAALEELPVVLLESLTDVEQRIFLGAIARERKACEEVDEQVGDGLVNLTHVCDEIERKVKNALWP